MSKTFDLDIPIPERSRWHFSEMPLNSSFEVPITKRASAHNAASAYKRNHPGWDYTIRTVNGGKAARLWRTA